MKHSAALQSLLFTIRQHTAFAEFRRAVEPVQLPRYLPGKADTLEQIGARTAFASGAISQHERWLTLLTGTPERENETSQQE